MNRWASVDLMYSYPKVMGAVLQGKNFGWLWGLFINGITYLIDCMKYIVSPELFSRRVSVSFKHCVFNWLDWWLQESSSQASVTTSIISNLLTQKICGWHNWFLCKIHSAFILFLTSTYKVPQKPSSYISVSEKYSSLWQVYILS